MSKFRLTARRRKQLTRESTPGLDRDSVAALYTIFQHELRETRRQRGAAYNAFLNAHDECFGDFDNDRPFNAVVSPNGKFMYCVPGQQYIWEQAAKLRASRSLVSEEDQCYSQGDLVPPTYPATLFQNREAASDTELEDSAYWQDEIQNPEF